MSSYLEQRRNLKLGITTATNKVTKANPTDSKIKEAELQVWFVARHKEMTGKCANCGSKTTKGNTTYWKFSIAHILPKKLFKSVATHEFNFLELCHFENSCHANYDNSMLAPFDMKCWPLIVERFKAIYPTIAKDELKHLPDCFLDIINQ